MSHPKIGRFIIRSIFDDHEELLRGVRRWDDLKEVWQENLETIEARKKDLPDIRIPIEVVFPGKDEGAEEHFQEKILRINAARNNNAQLTEEAKANKKGLYEEIKTNIDLPLLVTSSGRQTRRVGSKPATSSLSRLSR